MSWEHDYTDKQKCYCGKGYIVTKQYSDDWFRVKFYTYTDCKECYEYIKKCNRSECCKPGRRSYENINLVDDIEKYCND